jgi:hypothetical protein
MKEMLGKAENVKAAGKKWTDLLSRHSVARYAMDADRNEVAGRVYESRKAFDAALDDLCAYAQSEIEKMGMPLFPDAETLQT